MVFVFTFFFFGFHCMRNECDWVKQKQRDSEPPDLWAWNIPAYNNESLFSALNLALLFSLMFIHFLYACFFALLVAHFLHLFHKENSNRIPFSSIMLMHSLNQIALFIYNKNVHQIYSCQDFHLIFLVVLTLLMRQFWLLWYRFLFRLVISIMSTCKKNDCSKCQMSDEVEENDNDKNLKRIISGISFVDSHWTTVLVDSLKNIRCNWASGI